METLQVELAGKYNEMLQHIRYSWVFQEEGTRGWQLMDQSMEKMKHLALFAEAVAEDGAVPRLKLGEIDKSKAIGIALQKALEDVKASYARHLKLKDDAEFGKHGGLVMKMDLTLDQEKFQAEEIEDWKK